MKKKVLVVGHTEVGIWSTTYLFLNINFNNNMYTKRFTTHFTYTNSVEIF